MSLDSLLSTVLSGGIAASIARFFITKSLRDLESVIERIGEIKMELAAIAVKLYDHEKERATIHRLDKKIAVIENNLNIKKDLNHGRCTK